MTQTTEGEAAEATPARFGSGRWTPQAVIGLLCLVAGVVLRLGFSVEPAYAIGLSAAELHQALHDANVAFRVGEGLALFGGALLGFAPALPAPKAPGGGPMSGILLGLVLGGSALLVGCGPRLVTAERSIAVDIRRGPPCVVEVHVDGRLESRAEWSKRCEPTVRDGNAGGGGER